MSKKLLRKTTGNYLLFSVLILVISAPVFYLFTEKLYQNETDETLLMHKDDFVRLYENKFQPADIAQWNKYNNNIKILQPCGVTKDTLIDKIYLNVEEAENEPYRELWAPIVINGPKYTYVEKINLLEKDDVVKSIALMFLLVIVILLTVILWISKVSSAKLWRPFYDTLNQIKDFEIDKNKQPQFVDTDIDEFDMLNKSIGRLIEKNTGIYQNQREFIENAAHELQTPLALFQAKVDTLFQLPDISEAQSIILDSLNTDIARLNRLNKNLLLLSKIENGNTPEKQSVILNDYIKKHLHFFSEQANAKNLALVTDFKETLAIESNPEFAEILVNNLFLNAIRHNIKNGEIIITIAHKSLTFANTGQENPLEIDKLFNRFLKSNPSAIGNGLGLAIIKKIADVNQWQVFYSFSDNLHRFTVTF